MTKEQDKGALRPQTGNASNPSPREREAQPAAEQLIDRKGEKYLREAANIEDLPDPVDQQEMDEALKNKGETDKSA